MVLLAALGLNLQAWRIPLWDTWQRMHRKHRDFACLNLQAWRIPLWAPLHIKMLQSHQVSTSKPGESLCGSCSSSSSMASHICLNLQAWRIPLWATRLLASCAAPLRLNLQAWRIPLWAVHSPRQGISVWHQSQPPSLENPFVGTAKTARNRRTGLSLNLQAWRIPLWVPCVRSLRDSDPLSQPPSLENPFVGDEVSFALKYT